MWGRDGILNCILSTLRIEVIARNVVLKQLEGYFARGPVKQENYYDYRIESDKLNFMFTGTNNNE